METLLNSNQNYPKVQKCSGASWFTSWSCGLLGMCSAFSLTGLAPDFKCDYYYKLIHLSCTLSQPARVLWLLSMRYNWYASAYVQQKNKVKSGFFIFCIRLIKWKSKELCVQAVALKTSLICHIQNRHHIVNTLKCICWGSQGHNSFLSQSKATWERLKTKKRACREAESELHTCSHTACVSSLPPLSLDGAVWFFQNFFSLLQFLQAGRVVKKKKKTSGYRIPLIQTARQT